MLHKSVSETLDERQATYGSFPAQAAIAQQLKDVMHRTPGWPGLPTDRKEALDMIVHKMARVLNGGVEDVDHYHDIAGYAMLVERSILQQKPTKQP